MNYKTVVAKVSFGCQECESNQLTSLGAVKTEDGTVYIMYQCDGCGTPVPVSLNAMMIELFSTPTPKMRYQ